MLHGRVLRSPPSARARPRRARDRRAAARAASSCCRRTSPTRALRLPRPGHAVLARGRRALRRRPRRRRGRADAARGRAGARTASRPTTSRLPDATSLASRPRRRRAAAARRRRPASRGGRPGRACDPDGGNVLHTLPARARPRRGRLRRGRGRRSRASGSAPARAHAPLEPHAALAEWSDGRLTVWTGTQTPFNVRRELAGDVRRSTRATCAWSRRRWAAASAPRRSRGSRRSPPRSRARPRCRCASCCPATRCS